MQSEWQSRLDFLLVLVAIAVITLVVFKLLGPQIYGLTADLLASIGKLYGTINSLVTGTTG